MTAFALFSPAAPAQYDGIVAAPFVTTPTDVVDRMLALAESFRALAVAFLDRAVIVMVDRETAFQPVADLGIVEPGPERILAAFERP